jgi:hypothetical protein
MDKVISHIWTLLCDNDVDAIDMSIKDATYAVTTLLPYGQLQRYTEVPTDKVALVKLLQRDCVSAQICIQAFNASVNLITFGSTLRRASMSFHRTQTRTWPSALSDSAAVHRVASKTQSRVSKHAARY